MNIQMGISLELKWTEATLIICSVKMLDLDVVDRSGIGCTFLIAEGADELASNLIESHQFFNFGIVFGKAL